MLAKASICWHGLHLWVQSILNEKGIFLAVLRAIIPQDIGRFGCNDSRRVGSFSLLIITLWDRGLDCDKRWHTLKASSIRCASPCCQPRDTLGHRRAAKRQSSSARALCRVYLNPPTISRQQGVGLACGGSMTTIGLHISAVLRPRLRRRVRGSPTTIRCRHCRWSFDSAFSGSWSTTNPLERQPE